jgi:hypothetical protein
MADMNLAKDQKQDCIICQDTFATENMESRKCGHMTCQSCDIEWRRRANIVCTKKEIRDSAGLKKQYQYYIPSTCPMCRAEDTFTDFEHRSKKSLAMELSLALGMIFRRKTYKLEQEPGAVSRHDRPPAVQRQRNAVQDNYNPQEMDDLTRQIIQQLITDGQIEGSLVAPVPRFPAPVANPVARAVAPPVLRFPVPAGPVPLVPLTVPRAPAPPVVAPAPPVVAPAPPVVAPEPHHAYGVVHRPVGRPRQARNDICYNREHNLGCYTEKTKMKCPRCNTVVLCRSCKGKCPQCNR